MPKVALFLAAAVAFLATARGTYAADSRIAVLGTDVELGRAIALSLAPWGVKTIQSGADLPASSQPQATLQAVELARRLGVDAVVWVSAANDRSVLWVYDTRTEKITTRVLDDAPPFESSRAAAVALSVKTVLRASALAPAPERFGATPTGPVPKGNRLALETSANFQFLATSALEPRLGVGGVAWLTRGRWLGAALVVSLGPGVGVSTNGYQGRYREYTLGSALRWRWLDTRWLAAAAFAGATAHAARLDGSLASDSAEVEVSRLNASLDVGALFDFNLGGGAYLGVNAQASYLLAYQRYLVEGAPVFSLWPVVTSLGGHCGVALF